MAKSMTISPATGPMVGELPDFFRLPRRKTRDDYGFTEGWYRKRAAAGDIRLVRLRERGSVKGVTLVDRLSLNDYIRRCGEPIEARKETTA